MLPGRMKGAHHPGPLVQRVLQGVALGILQGVQPAVVVPAKRSAVSAFVTDELFSEVSP